MPANTRRISLLIIPFVALFASLSATIPVVAAPTITPMFQNYYSITAVLGAYPLYPFGGNYSALCFLPTDPNTLLIGAQTTESSRGIVPATLARNAAGHITGFSSLTGNFLYPAPHIDGGLAFGPNNVLFATVYPDNLLYEYNPGTVANTITKTVSLGSLGVSFSTGSVAFVPAGYPGAGGIRFNSAFYGQMYKADLTPDGNGTYNVSNVTELMSFGGDNNPEQMIWLPPNSPGFDSSKQYVLVDQFGSQQVAAYQLDANGVPIFNTQKTFISGIPGVIGAAIDPLTGDFLFSTTNAYGAGDHIYVVSPTAAPSGPAGDYNHNGIVDAADYTVWRDHFGQTSPGYTLPNEGDSVGTVNQADYEFWKLHFGDHSGGSGASANTPVPEPTTLGILLPGFLTLLCHRSRLAATRREARRAHGSAPVPAGRGKCVTDLTRIRRGAGGR